MAKKKGAALAVKETPPRFILRDSCKVKEGEAYEVCAYDGSPMFVVFFGRDRRPIAGLESPAIAPRGAVMAYFYEI